MYTDSKDKNLKNRIIALVVIISMFFLLFIGFLIKYQIVDSKGRPKAVSAYETVVQPSRGDILDRNGNYLASNIQINSLSFNGQNFPSSKEQKERNKIVFSLIQKFKENNLEYHDNLPIKLSANGDFVFDDEPKMQAEKDWLISRQMLGLNKYATANDCFVALSERYELEEYDKKTARDLAAIFVNMERKGFNRLTPYEFATDLPIEFISMILEQNDFFKGVEHTVVQKRIYNDGTLAPHILGRTAVIDAEEYKAKKEELKEKISSMEKKGLPTSEIEKLKFSSYGMNDQIGKDGIEKLMEKELKGKRGLKSTISGKDGEQEDVFVHDVEHGNNVILTIDKDLQKITEDTLKKSVDSVSKKTPLPSGGAAVVVKVDTGEILSCATYPTYDNNKFSELYDDLRKDKTAPLWNRPLMSTYEPGSTFKPAIATAGLEEKIITPSSTFTCNHYYTYFKDHTFTCLGYHRDINVSEAINKSCNIFFYETGRRLGIEKMNDWCSSFGLGQKTGVELPEASGVLAGIEERESNGGIWRPGDTVQAAIGQSDNQVTVLQLANYCATIANGGTRNVPHFIKAVKTNDYSETVSETEVKTAEKLKIHPENLAAVQEGMHRVGTIGFFTNYFSALPVEVGAKTGTAQVKKRVNGQLMEGTNRLLICYAPYEKPEIAVAIIIESSDKSTYVADVAKNIFTYYFSDKEVESRQAYNTFLP
ncbi:MAG: penicillin-binding transpeptidase domain-containing protein [Clostridia bacterium]|nr:penicillin-binding transpeptidase domain-containing protein [Clostridia bacterium]